MNEEKVTQTRQWEIRIKGTKYNKEQSNIRKKVGHEHRETQRDSSLVELE
jgi:hypothetical protein